MNWFESSILLMLGFFAGVYLLLVYLTAPGGPRRKRRAALGPRAPGLQGVRDEELAEFVRNRLRLRPGLAGVVATVREGQVHLAGRVGSPEDRELAGNVARSVPQVRAVVNELRVRGGEAVA